MGRFKKILIANRGEIALRVIRSCKELGIKTVCIYSDADRDSNYLSNADEIYNIGGPRPQESYLRIDRILEIAKRAKAQAIHPGYGFLSENPELARACTRKGVVFIGPSARSMNLLGNKLNAKKIAQKVGVPVIAGIAKVRNPDQIHGFASRNGYPVLLKAAAGGGGRGMRVIKKQSDIKRLFNEAQEEVRNAFKDPTIFAEKYLKNPRHIEVQVISDLHGNYLHLYERECSIQRKHQKLIEETPSVGIDEKTRTRLLKAAIKIAKEARYTNACTIEFLVDENSYYFLEVNTRLQVEHPVTEMVTGIDIVKQQILIAQGAKLSLKQDEINTKGHSIECRISAEDPFNNFEPSFGKILALKLPQETFTRIDTDLKPGYEVTIYYDSLLAKLIVRDINRSAAISKMLRILKDLIIVGVKTTIPFHTQMLQNKRFIKGDFHTRFIEDGFKLQPDESGFLQACAIAATLRYNNIPATEKFIETSRPLSNWQQAFTPLENPANYGGHLTDKVSIPYRKGGVKTSFFLTGFMNESL